METGAVRLGDICSGHGGYPPRNNVEGSQDVFINDIGAHTVGMGWASHCNKDDCHPSVAASGSPNVFVNDKQLCRIGDAVACGSSMVSGSSDVIIGDTPWRGD